MPIVRSQFLPTRTPFDGLGVLEWLARRAVAGVESASASRYTRLLSLAGGPAVVEVEVRSDGVQLKAELAEAEDFDDLLVRCRHTFGLAVDPAVVNEVLGSDELLAPYVDARPGLRLVGSFDGFEILVRTVVGQQVSVAGARTILGRLAAELGERVTLPLAAANGLDRLFPSPAALAAVDPGELPMPKSRARALVEVSDLVAAGELDLRPGADSEEVRGSLLDVPGIGPWTADHVLMRALGAPDVLLASDLVLGRALGELGVDQQRTAAWSPWRSYASFHLWRGL